MSTKKILAVLLALFVLATAVSGCGNSGSSSADSQWHSGCRKCLRVIFRSILYNPVTVLAGFRSKRQKKARDYKNMEVSKLDCRFDVDA